MVCKAHHKSQGTCFPLVKVTLRTGLHGDDFDIKNEEPSRERSQEHTATRSRSSPAIPAGRTPAPRIGHFSPATPRLLNIFVPTGYENAVVATRAAQSTQEEGGSTITPQGCSKAILKLLEKEDWRNGSHSMSKFAVRQHQGRSQLLPLMAGHRKASQHSHLLTLPGRSPATPSKPLNTKHSGV